MLLNDKGMSYYDVSVAVDHEFLDSPPKHPDPKYFYEPAGVLINIRCQELMHPKAKRGC